MIYVHEQQTRLGYADETVDRHELGWCMLSEMGHSPPSLWLYLLYVRPEYRGRGVATQLIARARSLAKSRGGRLYIEPLPYADLVLDAAQLRAWYERLGFQPSKVYGSHILVWGEETEE